MKKFLVSLIVLLFLVGFTAFAGGEKEKAQSVSPAEKVTLTMMTINNLPAPNEEFEKELDAFEDYMVEKGKPAEVDLTIFTGGDQDYGTKATLMMKSGQAPDLLVEETGRQANYMKAGYLLPLDEFIKIWSPWKDVYEPFKEAMSYKGHVYALPIQSCSIPLYYRKDLFEKAGLNTDWQPHSWDEIIEAAVVIKKNLPDATPLLFIGGREAGLQVTFSRFNLLHHGAGGNMYDEKENKWIVASEPLLNTFKFYEEITKKGLTNPKRDVAGDADNWASEAFSKGAGAIDLYGSWVYMFQWSPGQSLEIPDIENVVGYAQMPAMKPGASARGEDWVNQSGGWNYMIPATSKRYVNLAWDLAEFLSDAGRQARFNSLKGQVATRKDVTAHANYQQNKFLAKVSTWLPYTYIAPRIYAGWDAGPNAGIATALGKIMVGEWTALEAMKNFAKDMEQSLGKDKVMYKYRF
jgi:multiple sugar transport system substrate-binding protein